MINTYNESDLHATLKKLYALEYNGKTEIPIQNWICDIVTPDKHIFEIQTANVSKLAAKTKELLSQGYKVTIVHPLIQKKTIATYTASGELLSQRKSPRQESIYSLFRELTGIYQVLTKERFTLEVIFTEITEIRRKVEKPTQLINKSRRFLKDWIPQGKKLEAITKKMCFQTKADYTALIPKNLPDMFTIPELTKAISSIPEITALNKTSSVYAANQARIMVWLYTRMGILEECGKSGRSRLYTIKKA